MWADSAYPVRCLCLRSYKAPERDYADNSVFNNHVSILRIRSEHAIGYLKGRFQSWISCCIGIHAFAMDSEARANGAAGHDFFEDDPFLAEGLCDDEDPEAAAPPVFHRTAGTSERLQRGKRFREGLKEEFLQYQERRSERVRRRRM